MAEKVRAKRLLAYQNKQYGFSVEYKIRTNLIEYIERLIDERKASPGNWGNLGYRMENEYRRSEIFRQFDHNAIPAMQ